MWPSGQRSLVSCPYLTCRPRILATPRHMQRDVTYNKTKPPITMHGADVIAHGMAELRGW